METVIKFSQLFEAPSGSVYKNKRTNEFIYVKEKDEEIVLSNEENNLSITAKFLKDDFEFISLNIKFYNLIDYDLEGSFVKISHELITKKLNKEFICDDLKIVLNELSANLTTNEIQYVLANGTMLIVPSK